MMKLIDLLEQLDDLSELETVFLKAGRAWGPDSEAVVAEEAEDGAPPEGFDYFLEVDLVRDVLRVWQAWRQGQEPSPSELCEAVLFYAKNDAYKPA